MRCSRCERDAWEDTDLCPMCTLHDRPPREVAARYAALMAMRAGCDCDVEIRTEATAWGVHARCHHEDGCRLLLREMAGDN